MSYKKDPSGYPTQPPQGMYPSGPPPPYAPQAQQYAQYPAQYPPQQYLPQQYMQYQQIYGQGLPPPAYAYQPNPNPGYPVQPGYGGYPAPPQTHYVAAAQYDSGARFDGIASQNIPPAPPGCAPNAAQLSAAQGGTVFATQKKDNWFTGGKGGGMSFW